MVSLNFLCTLNSYTRFHCVCKFTPYHFDILGDLVCVYLFLLPCYFISSKVAFHSGKIISPIILVPWDIGTTIKDSSDRLGKVFLCLFFATLTLDALTFTHPAGIGNTKYSVIVHLLSILAELAPSSNSTRYFYLCFFT